MTLATLCLCMLLQVPLSAPASISETTGGIKAEVQTADGVPVAGVQIRLRHRDSRVWIALTDGKGQFRAGGLPPGEYVIESRLSGFKGEACPIQIRAQAWLLGVPKHHVARSKTGDKTLHFIGPSTYEIPRPLIQPQRRPELGKIPMH